MGIRVLFASVGVEDFSGRLGITSTNNLDACPLRLSVSGKGYLNGLVLTESDIVYIDVDGVQLPQDSPNRIGTVSGTQSDHPAINCIIEFNQSLKMYSKNNKAVVNYLLL